MEAQKDATRRDGTISDWRLSVNREQMIVKKGNVYSVGTPSTSVAASKTPRARGSTSTR